ncbi:MAG: alpha-1,6-mannanase [Alistipes sp.]|nr:alpha-1,6-mannanase [Alistipes sp.]
MKKLLLLAFLAAVASSCSNADNTAGNYPDNTRTVTADNWTWTEAADSSIFVLTDQFLNKNRGIFWKSPNNINANNSNLYWQQAHAMDVLICSYLRIRDRNPDLASEYEKYFGLWYENKANNYDRNSNQYGYQDDPTGFQNRFTDDMAWICLTLLNLTEATGNTEYRETARTVYDNYIVTRGWEDDRGWGIAWKDPQFFPNETTRNACTNTPAAIIALRLYHIYGQAEHLEQATRLYDFCTSVILQPNGKVGTPYGLTYTQGTFMEMCRLYYHITGDNQAMDNAVLAAKYTMDPAGDCCNAQGFLRDEGQDENNSFFKAVLVPYIINLANDEATPSDLAQEIKDFLLYNATSLWFDKVDRTIYPTMFFNYGWGAGIYPYDGIKDSKPGSCGAQTSGTALMEGMTRIDW